MIKYALMLTLCALSFSVNAFQTKQEIIDYCIRQMELAGQGNWLTLSCIRMELESQAKIEEMSKE